MLLLATGVSRSLTLLLPAVKQTNKKNGFIIEYTICNFLEIVCCIWIKAINLYISFVIKFVIVCKMPSFPVFPAFVWHFKASLPSLTPQPLCIPDTQAFSCSRTYGWFTTVTLLLGNHLWFGASDNVYVVGGGCWELPHYGKSWMFSHWRYHWYSSRVSWVWEMDSNTTHWICRWICYRISELSYQD